MTDKSVHDIVKDYYGKKIQNTSELETDACCSKEKPPKYIIDIIKDIHDEVVNKYYGCGLVIPEELEGTSILDIGSGSGRDVFISSKLVGENGLVVGVDMTDEQIQVANKHLDYHKDKFGFKKSNVQFKQGYAEKLIEIDGLKSNTFDIVISNCVINLCTEKEKVLKNIHTLLKQGGELYFSDIYSDRRIPKELTQDPVMYGECLTGALYWNDFINLAKKVGFADPRVVKIDQLQINNQTIKDRAANIKFYSITYRLFKIDSLDPACEDFGQAVIYKGTLSTSPHSFILDNGHTFEKGRVVPVCRNTFLMLEKSRFNKHFQFIGDETIHFGLFENCGKSSNPITNFNYEQQQQQTNSNNNVGGSCC